MNANQEYLLEQIQYCASRMAELSKEIRAATPYNNLTNTTLEMLMCCFAALKKQLEKPCNPREQGELDYNHCR